MFQSVQKAVYSVRNKPVCEFKNLCVTFTRIRHIYVIYPIHKRCLETIKLRVKFDFVVPKIKIHIKSQISFCKILKNK